MVDHKDSWKNEEVFLEQLKLNKDQLSNYPAHWTSFLKCIEHIKKRPIKLLDIGCGCGVYKKICDLNFHDSVKYMGIDYSEQAISIAKQEWGNESFKCIDLFNITSEFISSYDVLHLGALLDVMEDGEQAMKFILSFNIPHVILGRVDVHTGQSSSSTYMAYDKIITYKFKHNANSFMQIIDEMNYKIALRDSDTFLLERK